MEPRTTALALVMGLGITALGVYISAGFGLTALGSIVSFIGGGLIGWAIMSMVVF